MEMMQVIAGIWMLSYMCFWANSLNDPTRPESEMNPYSYCNCVGAGKLREMMAEEVESTGPVIYWYNAKAYVETGLITGLAVVMMAVCRAFA